MIRARRPVFRLDILIRSALSGQQYPLTNHASKERFVGAPIQIRGVGSLQQPSFADHADLVSECKGYVLIVNYQGAVTPRAFSIAGMSAASW